MKAQTVAAQLKMWSISSINCFSSRLMLNNAMDKVETQFYPQP